MDLAHYLEAVASDLARATALADDQTRTIAERLTTVLEPALRLAMVQLLSESAAQLTSQLGGPVVTVRMEGRDPAWSIQSPVRVEPAAEPETVVDGDDSLTRLTVRVPDPIKKRAEAMAQAEGQSLNAWIVQALRIATRPDTSEHTRSSKRRITGWA